MNDEQLNEPRLAVLAALHQGDAGLAYRIVLGLMGEGYPLATILHEVVAPIEYEAGRRWQVGDYSISEEHISTAAAEMLLATLAGAFDQPEDATHVVVCCAVGDVHTLPARMAAALLLAEGYRTTFLGSAVPADDLGTYLAEVQPAALVVACTLAVNLPGARAVIDAAHSAGVPVIVGGRAFGSTDARATAIGADAWVPSMRALVDLLETWPASARPPEARAPQVAEALGAMRATAVAALAAELVGEIAGGSTASPAGLSPVGSARVDEEASRLFDTLDVAVQLQDPDLVGEHAQWLAAHLATIADEPGDPDEILSALARAVADGGPEVASLLAEASTRLTHP